jgi:hypothetical protein
MLTADHVRARRKNGELLVRPLDAREKDRARELAEAYLEVALAFVGRSRDELEDAWSAVPTAPRDKRLADGLRKLIDDTCEFSAQAPVEPAVLRSEIFLAASAARKALAPEARFDRSSLVAAAAAAHSATDTDIERSLYADLRGEQILLSLGPLRAASLVERYDSGQVQAVLLRAVRVVADVACATPAAYRALFRELKFRRLLHRALRREEGGYRIEIDGPYSLFDSVTKYGLQLALVLPALEACDSLSLVAEVRWGKEREPLAFRHSRQNAGREAAAEDGSSGRGAGRLRDDVAALVEAFGALDTPWTARENDRILDLPGVGVCVPDLVFERAGSAATVYFEALGFWSRDAVWKRVELVEGGLASPILFAASSRLRVSEAVLDGADTAALYVYKGVMSARAIERKLDALCDRGAG